MRALALLGRLLPVLLLVACADVDPGPSHHARTLAPGLDYEPTTLLVRFEPDATPAEKSVVHGLVGAQVASTLDWIGVEVVQLPDGVDPLDAAAVYAERPEVVYAHPNWVMRTSRTPNDILFRDLWGLHNTGQSVTLSFVAGKADMDIDAPEAWGTSFGATFSSSGGARVGVLDTGIDQGHADLLLKTKACANAQAAIGVVVPGVCHDDNLHGTHVAGTIAAIADNGIGVAGVAPNAELAVFKALNGAGTGFYADVVAGIHWLHTAGGAKIISMSIGGPQDDALDAELSEAANAGVVLIAAAGNDGDATKNWPAYHPDVVSVAAINAAGQLASFSTCNTDVEINAPGDDIWSTIPNNGYAPLSGTSMATPHVSGVAAMIAWQLGLSGSQLRNQLVSATDAPGGCNNKGTVNLAKALGGSLPPPPPATPGAIAGTVIDQRSKTAIGGATVDCGSAGSATTSSSGDYSIGDVTPGTYTCTASASGYRNKSANVTVESGTTATADFALRKQ